MPILAPVLKTAVLEQLNCPEADPSIQYLDRLIVSYCRTVPWETVFRIVHRDQIAETAVCPRWPEQFWQDNIERGGGGTCFESNYAFFALLQTLGFEGYLTINNMGESIGCHSAIVILVNGQKWLVDAGMPIYAPIPISAQGTMIRATPYLIFAVRPDGENVYQIERWPHPKQNAFTFLDTPIDEETYRQRVIDDYGVDGLFLDHIIMNKIVDGRAYRFNMWEFPLAINEFGWGTRTDVVLGDDWETAVAQHFGMNEDVVRKAFALSQPKPLEDQ